MSVIEALLLVAALLGHAALWISLNNFAHAMPLGWRTAGGVITGFFYLGLVLVPAWFVGTQLVPSTALVDGLWNSLGWGWRVYLLACWAVALGPLALWAIHRLKARPPVQLLSNDSRYHDIAGRLGYRPLTGIGPRALLGRLPINGAFELEVNEKVLEVPRWPRELDGLSILHLSDLHFEGAITKDYFVEVARIAGGIEADLLAVTGDLTDRPHRIEWIAETIGPLSARWGKFFILGNHDIRYSDPDEVRRAMVESGYVDLGGRCQEMLIGGVPVLLAGNELPWIPPLPDMRRFRATAGSNRTPRILLAHTPDQINWARRHDFDLMLAGHTHGGQIRFPVIGPVICPSFHGTRYASGTFYQQPTLMHVSRGIASMQTLRVNCRPEITRLVLRAVQPSRATSAAMDLQTDAVAQETC